MDFKRDLEIALADWLRWAKRAGIKDPEKYANTLKNILLSQDSSEYDGDFFNLADNVFNILLDMME